MSAARRVQPPSGMPPPATAQLADGTVLELRPLAQRITAAHLRRHPEDVARYGSDLARQWCTHDNQHLLAWAVADADLVGQLHWLARVLDARGYPIASLLDDVGIGADVLGAELATPAGQEVAERMRAAAREVRAARESSA